MPKYLRLFLLCCALLAGCGPKAAKSCPADDQAADCIDPSLGYDAGIAEILNTRCQPCHAPGGEEASVPLTSYKQVSGTRMTIGNELVTCSMPPDGEPQLTDAERKQILDWLTCGAPQ